MRRFVLLTAVAACLFAAVPGHAFEVQSGGVPLSAEHVALLASRMAGLGGPAQRQDAPGDNRGMPPWMAGREGKAAEPAGKPGQTSMMGFMLGGRSDAQPAAGKPASAKGLAARR